MNELRFDHGQGSWPYLIPVEIRPTRTLSKPDGICSSGVGQHQVTAWHANLPYNAHPVEMDSCCPEVWLWKVGLVDHACAPLNPLLVGWESSMHPVGQTSTILHRRVDCNSSIFHSLASSKVPNPSKTGLGGSTQRTPHRDRAGVGESEFCGDVDKEDEPLELNVPDDQSPAAASLLGCE